MSLCKLEFFEKKLLKALNEDRIVCSSEFDPKDIVATFISRYRGKSNQMIRRLLEPKKES